MLIYLQVWCRCRLSKVKMFGSYFRDLQDEITIRISQIDHFIIALLSSGLPIIQITTIKYKCASSVQSMLVLKICIWPLKNFHPCTLRATFIKMYLKANCLHSSCKKLFIYRDVLFEFHLKFWYIASIGIPVKSLLLEI